MAPKNTIYKFIDNKGTFRVENPHKISYLYFPLTNKAGTLLSSISPNLAGDIKKDNDKFLTPPPTIEDIKHNLLCRRDFFIKVRGKKNYVYRVSQPWKDTLEAGFLYHKLIKETNFFHVEILNFIPFDLDVEVMWIKIKNILNKPLKFIPTSFIPLYGRGEKNLRDHRHVSALLNRIKIEKFGITLKPTMIFDERGHKENKTHYFVLGFENNKIPPQGQFPTLLCFTGEDGSLSSPQAVYRNTEPFTRKRKDFDGKEACAAFRFRNAYLRPNEETSYFLIMGICESKNYVPYVFKKLGSPAEIEHYLKLTKDFWGNHLSSLKFDFKNKNFNNWLLWVSFQPTLRKLFGCSFLPHFDYGKGGRGFRDLWQDILTLLLRDEPNIDKLLINNFKSIRIDGTNATIITKEGDFISDRNRIARVWADHGVWPLLTTKLYLEKTADLKLLFKNIPYFRDHQLKRAKEIDFQFNQRDYFLRIKNNHIYFGSILEHLLIENLVPFFNVGNHNLLKLENGDWNDGLDMAPEKGECAPFYCMYGYNLISLCEILQRIKRFKSHIEILKEGLILLDRIHHPINYNCWQEKRKLLNQYLDKTKYFVSGKKIKLNVDSLIADLEVKAEWVFRYIRKKEWLPEGFFNGYYDNSGRRVEGKTKNSVNLLLQSQVFPILSGVATPYQIKKIWRNINRYLKDRSLSGYRLNTNFKRLYLDLGRAFGFSYGDKENGAFFNHMVVMLANALYKRNFIREGSKVMESVWMMSCSSQAKIYPMLPEYFNSEGRGLYFYLTGSASWYIYTWFTEILGIKFLWDNLVIEPKLTKNNFFQNSIEVDFVYAGKKCKIIFERLKKKQNYYIEKAFLQDREIGMCKERVVINKSAIQNLTSSQECTIKIYLS